MGTAWRALGCGLLVALAGACSSKSVTSTTPSPTGTSPVSPSVAVSTAVPAPTPAKTTPGPSPSPSPSGQALVQNGIAAVTDANDGQTVTLHVGNHLQVALASTYWQFQPSSNPSVLRPEASPATSRSPGCVPGAGCGTVAVTFTALAPGHATVVATRTSCGEAMGCQGSAGHYQVEVVVAS